VLANDRPILYIITGQRSAAACTCRCTPGMGLFLCISLRNKDIVAFLIACRHATLCPLKHCWHSSDYCCTWNNVCGTSNLTVFTEHTVLRFRGSCSTVKLWPVSYWMTCTSCRYSSKCLISSSNKHCKLLKSLLFWELKWWLEGVIKIDRSTSQRMTNELKLTEKVLSQNLTYKLYLIWVRDR